MTDSWEAYAKLMPGSAVVTVDRHGAVSLFDGPVFFSINAGRWCAVDWTVSKVSVGLMPVTGDFSPETAYKLNPANKPELNARIMTAITGAPVETPVPNQWTGTLENASEMKVVQEKLKETPPAPQLIGFAEPDYQTVTPTVIEQTVQRPSVASRGGVIPVVTQAEASLGVATASLVVQSSLHKNSMVAELRASAAKLMTLADRLEKES